MQRPTKFSRDSDFRRTPLNSLPGQIVLVLQGGGGPRLISSGCLPGAARRGYGAGLDRRYVHRRDQRKSHCRKRAAAAA
jgi:hypothetical protein